MSSYVVTGAARGIGLEFVRQLSADSNNTVFALVRNKGTATELNDLSRNNIILAANEVSKATNGKLDYLISNAGKTNHPGLTIDQLSNSSSISLLVLLFSWFKTNTIGAVHCTNAFLPLLKNGSVKKVICISSGLGDSDVTVATQAVGEPSYSISKAALNMVVAKYAAQYKADGFTFLALSPGMVKTSMLPTARFAPDFKGPITPEKSVKMQLEVINRWTVEESGALCLISGTNNGFSAKG
ncbi:hypothetical protein DFH08DRAFT_911004 [Mycena albidolilacea]|uniref:NAD(P)-binding protein n=1 Tax=Mycena albidolilacea TaxID=1033008 RepID=A0AAD7AK52_9AGAR|nr:hypothetical protein DFH08DRAFT_911004 [Mycena albidolilacea]